MILTARAQPVEEFGHRGAGIGLLRGALAQFHQRIGFFRPGGENTARAVILERPPHQPLPVGQKRRGQRIAGMPAHSLAVEAKGDLGGPVDQPAAYTMDLTHRPRPRARATSRASSTAVISWLTVSRVTTSQDRSPCSWYHNSRCTPAGLSRR